MVSDYATLYLAEVGCILDMAKVMLTGSETVGDALRRFRKICDKEGVVNQSKRNAYYEKPSERRWREEDRRVENIKRAQYMIGVAR